MYALATPPEFDACPKVTPSGSFFLVRNYHNASRAPKCSEKPALTGAAALTLLERHPVARAEALSIQVAVDRQREAADGGFDETGVEDLPGGFETRGLRE